MLLPFSSLGGFCGMAGAICVKTHKMLHLNPFFKDFQPYIRPCVNVG